jgi:hypothetical protein
VDERHGVAVGGTDRDRASTPGQRSREDDDAGARREHHLALDAADDGPSVLAAGVRVVANPERAQHGS